eukprot:Gb_19211 [translate_table: standard]
MADLPCDGEGVCMVCKRVPPDTDVLLCNGCVSPWHMQCLNPPLASAPSGDWFCPDCSLPTLHNEEPVAVKSSMATPGDDLVSRIRAIQCDPNLSENEKAKKRQELMAKGSPRKQGSEVKGGKESAKRNKVLEMFDESLNCIFCIQLPDRPVTTPCGHNFCLKCFQRWMGQGKKNCAKCRSPIPPKMASQPRINSALVMAIRMAKAAACSGDSPSCPPRAYQYIPNQNKPDKAFTTERAKRKGLSNAASGRIFVTVPPDHFGPILAKNDPDRNQGVLVGECWGDRMECRQWGVHLPHVAGISGQSDYGAQSVALSGGYEDDEDHGEWFLYTGSGGRDLSGNKRTNKDQSFDQKFDKYNEALRVSCKMGYPVRVVRSHKEKRSSYAPENGVRYDGIYRIEKCWRKKGIQGFKVCRYLFVRCDNEPAPWTSDECGDQPRPLPTIDELKDASDITLRKHEPAWDWKDGVWGWTREPPASRKIGSESGKRVRDRCGDAAKFLTIKQKLLKEFSCSLCKNVLTLPLSTPCGHNFCKSCIEGIFAGQQDVRERSVVGGRSLRAQKIVKKCPTCQGDITDFLLRPQVNRQMEDVIRSLKGRVEDGPESDGDGDNEENGDQCEGTEDEEIEVKTCAETQQGNGSEEPKILQVDTLQLSTMAGEDKSVEVREVGSSDNKLQAHVDGRPLNQEQEKSIKELLVKYPRYSEELLCSMLADQDGDLKELEALLKALQRQETRVSRRVAVSSPARGKSDQTSVDKSTCMKEIDADVPKAFDNRKGNAAPMHSSPLKLQGLSSDEKKGMLSKKRACVKEMDAEVSKANDSRAGNAMLSVSSPLKPQNISSDESKGVSSKKRACVKEIDADVSEANDRMGIVADMVSSPIKLQNVSNDENNVKNSRKRERDVSAQVIRIYKTRGRIASDKLEVSSAAGSNTPMRDNVNSVSPSSPLLVVSDSDFE